MYAFPNIDMPVYINGSFIFTKNGSENAFISFYNVNAYCSEIKHKNI